MNKLGDKKINRKGFTLAEMLMALAILIVLLGVGGVAVIRYQRRLKLLEVNDTAKEIFIAAQNHLSYASSTGEWDNYYDTYKSSESKVELGSTVNENKLTDFANDLGIEYKDGDYRYLVYSPKSSTLNSTALQYILPFGSIDDTVRTGGSYIIEYNAKEAAIYGVWYTDDSATDLAKRIYDTELYTTRENTNTDKETRINYYVQNQSKYMIGYYGGAVAKSLERTDLNPIIVKYDNVERLYLNIEDSDSSVNKVYKIEFVGESSEKKATLSIDVKNNAITVGDGFSTYASEHIKDYFAKKDDGTIDFSHIIFTLDSVTEKNSHFGEIFAGFFPGENVTANVVMSRTDVLALPVKGSDKANSLFDSIEKTNESTTAYKNANISNIRHLQNLSTEISNIDVQADKINITSANLLNDLYFSYRDSEDNPGFAGKTGMNEDQGCIYLFNDDKTSCTAPDIYRFRSIENNNINSLKGNGYTIYDLRVLYSKTSENAGLFASVADKGLTINNLFLQNPWIYGQAGSSTGGFVGLVNANVSISSSGIVTTERSSDEESNPAKYYEYYQGTTDLVNTGRGHGKYVSLIESRGTTSSSNVGGLIGSISNGDVTIDNSFAAVPVYSANGVAGGLVGISSSNNVSITNSYFGGYVTYEGENKGTYTTSTVNIAAKGTNGIAGGVVGQITNTITLENVYSTGSVYGESFAGGFIGSSAGTIKANNTYAIGAVGVGTNGKAGYYSGSLTSITGDVNGYLNNIKFSDSNNKVSVANSGVGNNTSFTGLNSYTKETLSELANNKSVSKDNTKRYNATEDKYPYPGVTTISLVNSSNLYHYGDWAEPEDIAEKIGVVYYEVVQHGLGNFDEKNRDYYYHGFMGDFTSGSSGDVSNLTEIYTDLSKVTLENNGKGLLTGHNQYVIEEGYAIILSDDLVKKYGTPITSESFEALAITVGAEQASSRSFKSKLDNGTLVKYDKLSKILKLEGYSAYVLKTNVYPYSQEAWKSNELSIEIRQENWYISGNGNITKSARFYFQPIFSDTLSSTKNQNVDETYKIRSAQQLNQMFNYTWQLGNYFDDSINRTGTLTQTLDISYNKNKVKFYSIGERLADNDSLYTSAYSYQYDYIYESSNPKETTKVNLSDDSTPYILDGLNRTFIGVLNGTVRNIHVTNSNIEEYEIIENNQKRTLNGVLFSAINGELKDSTFDNVTADLGITSQINKKNDIINVNNVYINHFIGKSMRGETTGNVNLLHVNSSSTSNIFNSSDSKAYSNEDNKTKVTENIIKQMTGSVTNSEFNNIESNSDLFGYSTGQYITLTFNGVKFNNYGLTQLNNPGVIKDWYANTISGKSLIYYLDNNTSVTTNGNNTPGIYIENGTFTGDAGLVVNTLGSISDSTIIKSVIDGAGFVKSNNGNIDSCYIIDSQIKGAGFVDDNPGKISNATLTNVIVYGNGFANTVSGSITDSKIINAQIGLNGFLNTAAESSILRNNHIYGDETKYTKSTVIYKPNPVVDTFVEPSTDKSGELGYHLVTIGLNPNTKDYMSNDSVSGFVHNSTESTLDANSVTGQIFGNVVSGFVDYSERSTLSNSYTNVLINAKSNAYGFGRELSNSGNTISYDHVLGSISSISGDVYGFTGELNNESTDSQVPNLKNSYVAIWDVSKSKENTYYYFANFQGNSNVNQKITDLYYVAHYDIDGKNSNLEILTDNVITLQTDKQMRSIRDNLGGYINSVRDKDIVYKQFTSEDYYPYPMPSYNNEIMSSYGDWSTDNNTYIIYYASNTDEATGYTPPTVAVIGEDVTISKSGFYRENYEFVYWNSMADGSGKSYSSESIVSPLSTSTDNVTLFAIWREKQDLVTDFEYSADGAQKYIVKKTGIYMLEVWGAEGGEGTSGSSIDVINRSTDANGIASGGKGGYAKQYVYLKEGEVVYVYVGGRGRIAKGLSDDEQMTFTEGGWNGGGNAKGEYNDGSQPFYWFWGSGGGATHMAIFEQEKSENSYLELKDFKNDTDKVLLVAGGGGGAGAGVDSKGNPLNGGAGGGAVGSNGKDGRLAGNSLGGGYGGGAKDTDIKILEKISEYLDRNASQNPFSKNKEVWIDWNRYTLQNINSLGTAKLYYKRDDKRNIMQYSLASGNFGTGGLYGVQSYNGAGGGGGWYGGGSGYWSGSSAGGGSGALNAGTREISSSTQISNSIYKTNNRRTKLKFSDLMKIMSLTDEALVNGSEKDATPSIVGGTFETGHSGAGHGRITFIAETDSNKNIVFSSLSSTVQQKIAENFVVPTQKRTVQLKVSSGLSQELSIQSNNIIEDDNLDELIIEVNNKSITDEISSNEDSSLTEQVISSDVLDDVDDESITEDLFEEEINTVAEQNISTEDTSDKEEKGEDMVVNTTDNVTTVPTEQVLEQASAAGDFVNHIIRPVSLNLFFEEDPVETEEGYQVISETEDEKILEIQEDSEFDLSELQPELEGYTLVGWRLEEVDGENEVEHPRSSMVFDGKKIITVEYDYLPNETIVLTSDMSLQAIWTKNDADDQSLHGLTSTVGDEKILELLRMNSTGNPYPLQWNNCTWAAWTLAKNATGISLPNWGDAGYWYSRAQAAGLATSSTKPRANSIVVWSHHVGFVSAVSENGNYVYIKEGNYAGTYHEGWWPATGDRHGQKLYGYIYLGDAPEDSDVTLTEEEIEELAKKELENAEYIEISVDEFVGHSSDDFLATIHMHGLTKGIVTEVYNNEFPEGSIISHDSGTLLLGTAVNYTVSLGKEENAILVEIVTDEFVGHSEEDFINQIYARGLVKGEITTVYDDNFPEGSIMQHSAGQVKKGSAVNYTVSLGKATPKLITILENEFVGKTEEEFLNELQNRNLVKGEVTEVYDDEIAKGIIIKHTVGELAEGLTVNYTISLGKEENKEEVVEDIETPESPVDNEVEEVINQEEQPQQSEETENVVTPEPTENPDVIEDIPETDENTTDDEVIAEPTENTDTVDPVTEPVDTTNQNTEVQQPVVEETHQQEDYVEPQPQPEPEIPNEEESTGDSNGISDEPQFEEPQSEEPSNDEVPIEYPTEEFPAIPENPVTEESSQSEEQEEKPEEGEVTE